MLSPMRTMRTVAIIITAMAVGTPVHAAVIGNPLVNGSSAANNLSSGNDYVLGEALPQGQIVTTWGIFNDTDAVIGSKATPFLAAQTGTVLNVENEEVPEFQIVAVGTTRTVDAGGIQMFDFDAVSGAATIGANTFFGWRDGGVSADDKNGSILEYSPGLAPPAVRVWFSHGSMHTDNDVVIGAAVTTRTSHSIATLFNRTYSVQVQTAIPEPASLALLALGGAMMLRRRSQS